MSELCKIPRYTRPSFVLSNCCQKQICQFHISEHCELFISQLHPLVDEITVLDNELKSFDIYKTNIESREKLKQ